MYLIRLRFFKFIGNINKKLLYAGMLHLEDFGNCVKGLEGLSESVKKGKFMTKIFFSDYVE